jgi:predicted O-methyltransferase YrrM
MLQQLTHSLMGNEVAIVRNGPRVDALAAALRRPPRLDRETQSALGRVRQAIAATADPAVARHFASASSPPFRLAILAELVRHARATSILEIGTGYGMSAIAMARAQAAPRLVTLEASEPQKSLSRRQLETAFPDGGVEPIGEDKVSATARLIARGDRYDFVFHDGGHDGDAYMRDFTALLPALQPGAMFVIDDIRWDDKEGVRQRTRHSSRTCYEGWREVVAHPRVTGALEVRTSLGVLLLA